MKNKLLGLFIAILCCGLLFVCGSVLVLFLAPGTEIFGIRYVASGTSKCEINKPIGEYKDIYIDTKNVPISIDFNNGYASSVEFCQNFIGFTRTKDKVANLSMTTENGDLHITANEIEEFVYSQKADEFFRFKLALPSSFFNGTRSLYIKSKTSSVSISGNATIKNLTVDTAGGFSVLETSTLQVNDKLTVKSSKLLDLGTNVSFFSCDLTSTGNNINIGKAIAGDIKATTKGGDLKFVSCRNLEFSSKSGAVKAYGEGTNTVRGTVNISTGGSVTLGEVNTSISSLASGEEVPTIISTKGGAISVAKLYQGKISSTRGRISIDVANTLEITSGTGNVSVKNISSKIVVNGKNGKVTLGEGGVIMNPEVKTSTGVIEVYNTAGTVNLYSKSNDVTFTNDSSKNITLYSGKKIVAKKLKGTVEAYSRNDGKYVFDEISGNVTITSGTRADHIKIDATCAKIGTVDYDLKSTKSTKAQVKVGETVIVESSSIKSTMTEGHYLIKVETSYGEIVLSFMDETPAENTGE